jgi:hypothetical protein
MVTSATTIEYRIRYSQVSSGHSAITALQLIKFLVCPCRQPRRRGPPVTNTKTTSSRFQNVQRPSPRIECQEWLFSRRCPAKESGSDDDDGSPSQYRKPGSKMAAVAVLRNQTGNQIMRLNRKDLSHHQVVLLA